jgi:hypothetical protein
MSKLIFNLLNKQLNEQDKEALVIDLNNGLYNKIEELILIKLAENIDMKQLYTACAKEYLASKKTCINCKFYKSDGEYCSNSIMEQEYCTPFYPPKQITFYCDLVELKDIEELINGN